MIHSMPPFNLFFGRYEVGETWCLNWVKIDVEKMNGLTKQKPWENYWTLSGKCETFQVSI